MAVPINSTDVHAYACDAKYGVWVEHVAAAVRQQSRACQAIENGAFLQRFSLSKFSTKYIIHDAYPAGKSNAGSRQGVKVEYGMLLFFWSWRECGDYEYR